MNLIKKLWNSLVNKTSTSPKLVVVAEVKDEGTIDELFVGACMSIGIGQKILEQTNAIALFCDWYDGPATSQAVLAAIPDFTKDMGGTVNAKFQRHLKKIETVSEQENNK